MVKKIAGLLFLSLSCMTVESATTYTWTGAGSDNLWTTTTNWTPAGGPPIAADSVQLNHIANPGQYPLIHSATPPQTVYALYGGYVAGTEGVPNSHVLNIDGGHFIVTYKAFCANKAYTTGTWNLSGSGASIDIANQLDLATQASSIGTLNINGGQCRIGSVPAGSITVYRGTGTINVNGGTLTRTDGSTHSTIVIPYQAATPIVSAHINLNSGLIDIDRLNFLTSVPVMNINDGTFKAAYFGGEDDDRQFDRYVAGNQITAFNDDPRGVLNVALEGTKTVVTASLSSPQQAWNPAPTGRAVPLTSKTLTWSAGDGATSHDVYVGSVLADVEAANHSSAGIFRGNQTDTAYLFSGGQLGLTVYWRIDEVSAGTMTKGDVWSFIIRSSLAVEDFESYGAGMPVTGVWTAAGGAAVALSESPNPIRDTKAMTLTYANGTAGFSQAARTFSVAQDWTVSRINAVDVWYSGNPANGADTIYMVVSDGTNSAVQYLPASAVQTVGWNVWHVVLADFTGVNRSAVTSVKVGVGNPVNPTPHAASGTVYFDDLLLYGTRCLTPIGLEAGDLNQDCAVNLKDLDQLAHGWLDSGNPDSDVVAWSEGTFTCQGETVPYMLGVPTSSLKRDVLCVFPRYTETEILEAGTLNDLAVRLVSNGITVITFPSKWADLVQQRDAILQGIDTFVQTDARINCVLDVCKNSAFYSGEKFILIGTSRYGFATLHAMAGNPDIEAGVVILPVTYWPFLSEFQGMDNNPIIQTHDLTAMVNAFPPRNLYMLIATDDTRVSTEKALELAGHLRTAYEQAGRPDAFSSYLSPSTGHSWNGPMNLDIMVWFKNQNYLSD